MEFFKNLTRAMREDISERKEEIKEAVDELLEDNVPGLRPEEDEETSQPIEEADRSESVPSFFADTASNPEPSSSPKGDGDFDFTLIERETFRSTPMRYCSEEALTLAACIFMRNQGQPGTAEAKLLDLVNTYGLTIGNTETLEKTNASLKEALNAAKKANVDLDSEVSDLKADLTDVYSSLADAKTEAKTAKAEAENMKAESEAAKAKAKEAEAKLKDTEAKLTEAMQGDSEKVSKLQKELQETKSFLTRYVAQVSEAPSHQEMEDLKQKLKAAEQEQEQMIAQWEEFEDQLSQWVDIYIVDDDDEEGARIVGVELKEAAAQSHSSEQPENAASPEGGSRDSASSEHVPDGKLPSESEPPVKTGGRVGSQETDVPAADRSEPVPVINRAEPAPVADRSDPSIATGSIGSAPVVNSPEPAPVDRASSPDRTSRLPRPAACYIDDNGQIHDREFWKRHGKPDWDREIHWRLDTGEFSEDEVPAEIARRFRRGETFDCKKDDDYANAAMKALKAMNGDIR